MIKVIVTGAAGRMGSRIISAIQEIDGITVAGALERTDHPSLGFDAGDVAGVGPLGVKIEDRIENIIDSADVVIDFSSPDAVLYNIEKVCSAGKSIVIGTTGLLYEGEKKIREYAVKIPCVFSPNMSVGVNVVFKVIQDIAKVLGDEYDVEIVEAHHRHKKDAPSGTAMRMAHVLADALGRNLAEVGRFSRHGIIGERTQQEIGIQTIRAGDIVGDHTVLFCGNGERIEVTHRAHTRDNFARGAVRAAMWVVNQKPGLYDMMDVLGLK
ncbi:MAG: 4-hydroxy-tetrahydrodipicolinate reductase [Nitrospira sp.]|nr:4-hydroxy-tetrahydrodipicolinate reductase [Nitrospira sp.]